MAYQSRDCIKRRPTSGKFEGLNGLKVKLEPGTESVQLTTEIQTRVQTNQKTPLSANEMSVNRQNLTNSLG